MRIKFVIALALAVVCLLPVATGSSNAQQDEPTQANLDYTVYLPLVAKPPCQWIEYPKLYSSINKPVARIGEVVTVTGVLVNDCSQVGHPLYVMTASSGALSLTVSHWFGYPIGVPPGSTQIVTLTALAVSPGEAEIGLYVSYETANPTDPSPIFYYDSVSAKPITIRVLP